MITPEVGRDDSHFMSGETEVSPVKVWAEVRRGRGSLAAMALGSFGGVSHVLQEPGVVEAAPSAK